MKYILITIILIASLSVHLNAQKLSLKDKHYCNAHHSDEEKESVYLLEPSESAKRLLDTISKATGLDKGAVILKGADVDIALAVLDGKKRYILINELAIIDSESDIDNRYQLYFLIAHELAHHALGHTLDEEGSRHEYELKADEFAGFAMAKLGATLEQTLSITEDFDEEETDTHPPKSIRKQQITIGWKNGKEGIKPNRPEPKPEVEIVQDNFKDCGNGSFKDSKVKVKNYASKTYHVTIKPNVRPADKVRLRDIFGVDVKNIVVVNGQEVNFGIYPAGFNFEYIISGVQVINGQTWREQIPYKTGYFSTESCTAVIINIE